MEKAVRTPLRWDANLGTTRFFLNGIEGLDGLLRGETPIFYWVRSQNKILLKFSHGDIQDGELLRKIISRLGGVGFRMVREDGGKTYYRFDYENVAPLLKETSDRLRALRGN